MGGVIVVLIGWMAVSAFFGVLWGISAGEARNERKHMICELLHGDLRDDKGNVVVAENADCEADNQ